MREAELLLQLAGEAALLLWGLHMVQSGVERAFGSRLRHALGLALGNHPRAFLAGLGVTAVLQSSTATGLMIGSFAAAGAVALGPALAAMAGANVGTALIVQVLSFDVSAVFPALVLVGVLAFRRGRRTRTRDLGRVAIGLGLMLLALHLMLASMTPIEASPTLRMLLTAIAGQPLPNLLLALVLAWAAHSSVAGVLFVASLAGSGVTTPEAALAMVLGANIGSALNPLLEAGGDRADPARLRVPLGNMLNRLAGAAVGLALLPQAVAWLQALDPAPARLVANAHLAFNLATAGLSLPLLPALGRLLQRLLPDRTLTDPAAPRYLDEAALGTPSVALANAAREVLRMADQVEAMLQASADAFREADRDAAKSAARLEEVVGRLHRAVHGYIARIPRESLGEEEARRLQEVQALAIALSHAADVIERDLLRHAAKRLQRDVALAPAEQQEVLALHVTLQEQLRLAIAVFMLADAEAARALVRGKEGLRVAEQQAAQRLAEAPGEAAGLLLEAVRDLRRVGSHLAVVAHPLLERRGELLPSRLATDPALADGDSADNG
ncbi:Na/Pi cotransporter family protein [Roseicella aquatilis]|uniref:Na/Pi cotransporter family protein n=1 Tax=Roseicella aquatilis TaxID=2527868 RepID=A0A4R4DS06_9PROT|nr:Na/Pi cotransporter family protein [Roseicella aquatilis]TCZ64342.1 Na/Pi cotransporter family protein [Roseicella aquatilis]